MTQYGPHSVRKRHWELPDESDPITRSLLSLSDRATHLDLAETDRIVILSDMHIGNARRGDDFRKNAELCMACLNEYYLPRGFTLILNGDIEELHRFTLKEIEKAWPSFYELFLLFGRKGRLLKTIGNHDILLPLHRQYRLREYMHESVRIRTGEDTLFVFHGHQASMFQTRFNMASGVFLRFVARPLGIKSYSVSADKGKQFRVERKVYNFSSVKRIASIVGHTHRPLFESLSKADALRYKIERLCREYAGNESGRRDDLRAEIVSQKSALDKLYEKGEARKRHLSIYNSKLLVPCLFNSGCAIGKRGITLIEISGETISLVHWFDGKQGARHLTGGQVNAEPLSGTSFYRLSLNQEKLSYIFARIHLLAD